MTVALFCALAARARGSTVVVRPLLAAAGIRDDVEP
jgi:hypothetical protein